MQNCKTIILMLGLNCIIMFPTIQAQIEFVNLQSRMQNFQYLQCRPEKLEHFQMRNDFITFSENLSIRNWSCVGMLQQNTKFLFICLTPRKQRFDGCYWEKNAPPLYEHLGFIIFQSDLDLFLNNNPVANCNYISRGNWT